MILGIGSDLCDITRIEKSLARFGDRFTHRVFTEGERAKSDRRATRAASYARRFAAKEACSKALGTGMALGVFNTLMSLGIFTGGVLGGLVLKAWGASGIFLAGAALMLLWLAFAWRMRPVAATPSARP